MQIDPTTVSLSVTFSLSFLISTSLRYFNFAIQNLISATSKREKTIAQSFCGKSASKASFVIEARLAIRSALLPSAIRSITQDLPIMLFSAQIFFLLFQESLECAIVIAVLLALISSGFASDRPLRKALRINLYFGIVCALVMAFSVGVAIVAVWIKYATNLWIFIEHIWRAAFSLAESLLLSFLVLFFIHPVVVRNFSTAGNIASKGRSVVSLHLLQYGGRERDSSLQVEPQRATDISAQALPTNLLQPFQEHQDNRLEPEHLQELSPDTQNPVYHPQPSTNPSFAMSPPSPEIDPEHAESLPLQPVSPTAPDELAPPAYVEYLSPRQPAQGWHNVVTGHMVARPTPSAPPSTSFGSISPRQLDALIDNDPNGRDGAVEAVQRSAGPAPSRQMQNQSDTVHNDVDQSPAPKTSQDDACIQRKQQWLTQIGRLLIFLIPFVTLVREGVVAIVVLGGMVAPSDPSSLGVSGFSGIACGASVGVALYFASTLISQDSFLTFASPALLVLCSGLFARSVRGFQRNEWLYRVGILRKNVIDFDVRTVVWNFPSCDPRAGNAWGLLQATLGWESVITVSSASAYLFFWACTFVALFSIQFASQRKKEKSGSRSRRRWLVW
ncbi:hypothetical protein DFJ73DRAFT_287831 [Zopfochytrium polystomum]|nr:hypothetical protein DFJ73DRAFT_287831 [Zopfochytrium polystomum]